MVVAAVEHRSAALAHPIHGTREPGADANHAAGECFLAVRLDDRWITPRNFSPSQNCPPLPSRPVSLLLVRYPS
jgi:hypothetical protein